MTEEEIDALVDAQLAQEPSGYDHNLGQPECPHCGDDFHGLAVTERMRQMRRFGEVDPDYRYDEDTSPVVCPGSLFVGPPPPPPPTLDPLEALFDRLMNVVDNDVAERAAAVRLPSRDIEYDYEALRVYTRWPQRVILGVGQGADSLTWTVPDALWLVGNREVIEHDDVPDAPLIPERAPQRALPSALAHDGTPDPPGRPPVPRPSTSPPMWAHDPTRSRRSRNV
ncbi:hypothetical protein [Tomitella cavernea]|uniref:Uncharacterized protein n=1 Tax=Tomitella cavernea TaxID=1387982 RepID=A0ABP9CKG0_9ACTN|nr:hypothetical protein [Tomitella cavernea]